MIEKYIRRPQDELLFLSFSDERNAIINMRSRFDMLRASGAPANVAYLKAFESAHARPGKFDCVHHGPDSFGHMLFAALSEAGRDIRDAQRFIVPDIRPAVEMPNLVDAPLSAVELLRLATMKPHGEHEEVTRRDAMRKLVIGHQYLCIELADPEAGLGRDILRIERLRRDTTAQKARMPKVDLIAPRSQDRAWQINKRALRCYIDNRNAFLDRESYLDAKGEVSFSRRGLRCRVLEIDKVEYLVYTRPRGKGRFATHLKLLRKPREEWLKDQRGWRDVVIGSLNSDGSIRLASREDARRYMQYCLENLWSCAPLCGKEDDTEPDDSHVQYWDLKVLGHIDTDLSDSILFRGRVEQQITTARDWMAVESATNGLNHAVRRGKQMLELIFPDWFPDINWVDDEIIQDHCDYWSQLQMPRTAQL